MMWLVTLALAGELDEPVAVREPVKVGTTTYTSPEPIYLLPTPTFDRMLADTKKLSICREGLTEVEGKLGTATKELEQSRTATFLAIDKAGAALVLASDQMKRDGQQDQAQVEQLMELQRKLGRAQSQRNVALGVATGVVSALVVYGVASR